MDVNEMRMGLNDLITYSSFQPEEIYFKEQKNFLIIELKQLVWNDDQSCELECKNFPPTEVEFDSNNRFIKFIQSKLTNYVNGVQKEFFGIFRKIKPPPFIFVK